MKTISLTEEAYRRLVTYKEDEKDSFTKVILRLLPEKGSAAEIGEFMAHVSPLTGKEAGVMRKTMAEANQWQENAWK
ncbi:antitoxin VapB family protein [Oscillatoria laete-virens NRMC-F 0139]|nr:antitoxin VapB family protein [Oscillatoria laete-virens]MDL5053317.1 antitoxin VapB family protein [Oscillatoria laete-virens NRMC-F 0139]